MAERDSDYLVIAPFAWTNTGSSISSSNSSKSVESWVCQNWANSWIESVLGNLCAFIVSSSRCKRAVANLCRALAGEHLLGQRRNRNAMVTDVPLAPRSGVEDPRRRVVERRLEVAVGYNAVAPPPRPLWFCRSSSTSGTVSGTWEPLPVPRTRLPAWRQVATPRIAHRFLSGLDKPCRHVGVRLAVPCGPSLKPNRVGQALPYSQPP